MLDMLTVPRGEDDFNTVAGNRLDPGGFLPEARTGAREAAAHMKDLADRTEWHRIVTFQDGLVEMLEKHAKKGRLVYVSGKLQTRKWRKDGEDSDRFSTEILLVPGGRVQFLDKPNGNGAPAMNGDTVPSGETAATADDSEIPF